MTKLINLTDQRLTIPILDANSQKDSVNLQPRARADLPDGAKIDPFHEARFAKAIRVTDEPVASLRATRAVPEQAGESKIKTSTTAQGSSLGVIKPSVTDTAENVTDTSKAKEVGSEGTDGQTGSTDSNVSGKPGN